jgi:hypothetical protein
MPEGADAQQDEAVVVAQAATQAARQVRKPGQFDSSSCLWLHLLH